MLNLLIISEHLVDINNFLLMCVAASIFSTNLVEAITIVALLSLMVSVFLQAARHICFEYCVNYTGRCFCEILCIILKPKFNSYVMNGGDERQICAFKSINFFVITFNKNGNILFFSAVYTRID